MVGLKDIAKITGFAVSTVSRALSGNSHVDDETRRIVLDCAKELNYSPNYYAQNLKKKISGTIAFLVPNINNMLYPPLACAIEEQARLLGYSVLICNTFEDPELTMRYISKLESRHVDGFLISTSIAGDMESNLPIKVLKNSGYPTVCLLRESPDSKDSLVVDNENGAIKAIDFLASRGMKKIAYLSGQEELVLYQQRKAGYINGMKKNNLTYSEEDIWSGFSKIKSIAYSVVKESLKDGNIPDAIFAASDPLALDAMKAIHDLGFNIPNDISVIGFDNLPVSELIHPGLTTVSQPFEEIGKEAVKQLVKEIEDNSIFGQDLRVFNTEIKIRESVK